MKKKIGSGLTAKRKVLLDFLIRFAYVYTMSLQISQPFLLIDFIV